MSYGIETKTARMAATRDQANGGFIDLLTGAGAVLATFPLDNPCGTVAADVWTITGFPKTVAATAASTSLAPVATARVRAAGGAIVKSGLAVGLPASSAPVKIDNGEGTLLWTALQQLVLNAPITFTHAA